MAYARGAVYHLPAVGARVAHHADRARGRGHGEPYRADGFLGSASRGARYAGGGHGVVGARYAARALGHLAGYGLAHGTVAHDVVVVDPQHVALGLVAVCDGTEQEVCRGAGHGGEARGYGAARAALGCGEGEPALDEQVVHQALHRGVLKADDVLRYDVVEAVEERVDGLARGVGILHVVGRQAQAHDIGRGQVGELYALRQGVLPCGYALGEHRLGQPCGDHRAVDVGVECEVALQARHHLVLHQVLHLEGHARQRHHDASAVGLEPHARGRTVKVGQHGAGVGHQSLRAVQLVELYAAACEHRAYVLGHGLVLDHACAEDAREGELGDVVLGGAEASRQDHHLRLRQRMAQRLLDASGVVAHRETFGNGYACGVELLGYACRVGIDDLTDEDLVAYGDYGCLYHDLCVSVCCWVFRLSGSGTRSVAGVSSLPASAASARASSAACCACWA